MVLQPVVDRIEHDQPPRRLHVGQQVEALGAAVHHRDAGRQFPLRGELLDAAHAEALVGPQQVADTEHQNFAIEGVERVHSPRAFAGPSQGGTNPSMPKARSA
jgi:hypothetical protein